jgi:hypothetical protein
MEKYWTLVSKYQLAADHFFLAWLEPSEYAAVTIDPPKMATKSPPPDMELRPTLTVSISPHGIILMLVISPVEL